MHKPNLPLRSKDLIKPEVVSEPEIISKHLVRKSVVKTKTTKLSALKSLFIKVNNYQRYWLVALFITLLGANTAYAKPYEKLILGGPTAAVSFPLMHMVETGALDDWADTVEFKHWKNVDQLRVLLAKNQLDFSAAPINLPAIMFNKGMDIKLLNVSVWGLLWLVSNDPEINNFDDLAKKPLLSTYQRDLPAILLNTLFKAKGLVDQNAPDIRYARDAQDAISLMLTGQADSAILPEPIVSLLLARNEQQYAKTINRVISLEDAWSETFTEQPDLPQAGIMANVSVAKDDELSKAFNEAYKNSAIWCKSEPRACAKLVHKNLDFLPVDALEQSIKVTRIDSHSASSVQTKIEDLYKLMLANSPEVVGAKLPVQGFYGP